MKYINDLNVKGKKVLVRCDFNVPVDEAGNILDDFRIQKTLPTIQYLLSQKAKIILITHLGEPNGVVIENLKLDKVKERLETLLGISVIKMNDCVGQEVESAVSKLATGEILLLENVRFHKGETDNDKEFAKQLSELGELYINDAFGDCHRSHASMVGIPEFLPHGMGLLVQNELENLNKILQNPDKPLVVLVGGKKVQTKSAFIENILKIADKVIMSGLIKKEVDKDNIIFKEPEKIVNPSGDLGALDINNETIKLFTDKILSAKTVVWNGPFGKFEDQEYKKGTLGIAKAIIKSKAFSVVGGGETIEFLRQEGMLDKFTHVSTGGGAMLEFLSGQALPGLEALK